MRSKLVIAFGAGIGVGVAISWMFFSRTVTISQEWDALEQLLWFDSQANAHSVFSREYKDAVFKEVTTPYSRFMFVSLYPGRRIPGMALYSYEQINSDTWVLRGTSIIKNVEQYTSSTVPYAGKLMFTSSQDGVDVFFENIHLMTLKSSKPKPSELQPP